MMNQFLAISWIHVDGHGLKHHWCRYYKNISSGIDVCVLLIEGFVDVTWCVGCVGFAFKGANQRLDCKSLGSSKIWLHL